MSQQELGHSIKKRLGFVSNSSSSSFVIIGKKLTIPEMLISNSDKLYLYGPDANRCNEGYDWIKLDDNYKALFNLLLNKDKNLALLNIQNKNRCIKELCKDIMTGYDNDYELHKIKQLLFYEVDIQWSDDYIYDNVRDIIDYDNEFYHDKICEHFAKEYNKEAYWIESSYHQLNDIDGFFDFYVKGEYRYD
jgi:hypothetical protein